MFSDSQFFFKVERPYCELNHGGRSLDGFIRVAKYGKDSRSQMYREVLPQLEAVKLQGLETLKKGAPDQNEVFLFAYRFSKLLDLPRNFSNFLGKYIGSDYIDHYTETEFQNRVKELSNDGYKFNFSYAQQFGRVIDKKPEFDLNTGFPYLSLGKLEIPNQKFIFQYKYIFQEGYIPILVLFKDRENGKTYVGVSRRAETKYDGSNGNSTGFLKHDLIHSYVQKYFDYVFFKNFNIKTLKEAIRIKKQTHQLLQKTISDYKGIKNKDLVDGIELVLFSLLHEQSMTYPYGTHLELSTRPDYYEKIIKFYLKNHRFGKEYGHLIRKTQVVKEAIEWVLKRTSEESHALQMAWGINLELETQKAN